MPDIAKVIDDLAAAEERMHAADGEQLAEDFTAGQDAERLHRAVNDSLPGQSWRCPWGGGLDAPAGGACR